MVTKTQSQSFLVGSELVNMKVGSIVVASNSPYEAEQKRFNERIASLIGREMEIAHTRLSKIISAECAKAADEPRANRKMVIIKVNGDEEIPLDPGIHTLVIDSKALGGEVIKQFLIKALSTREYDFHTIARLVGLANGYYNANLDLEDIFDSEDTKHMRRMTTTYLRNETGRWKDKRKADDARAANPQFHNLFDKPKSNPHNETKTGCDH